MSATEAEVIQAINFAQGSVIACQSRIGYEQRLLARLERELASLREQLAALKRLRGESE